jgi:hypothetical protein
MASPIQNFHACNGFFNNLRVLSKITDASGNSISAVQPVVVFQESFPTGRFTTAGASSMTESYGSSDYEDSTFIFARALNTVKTAHAFCTLDPGTGVMTFKQEGTYYARICVCNSGTNAVPTALVRLPRDRLIRNYEVRTPRSPFDVVLLQPVNFGPHESTPSNLHCYFEGTFSAKIGDPVALIQKFPAYPEAGAGGLPMSCPPLVEIYAQVIIHKVK